MQKKEAQLCCSSCKNVPVCLACTYNKHKDHDLHDVTEIAERERTLLKQELAELTKYKEELYGLPTKIQTTKQKLNENAMKKKEGLINQHKQQAHKIKEKLAECTKERKRGIDDIGCRRKNNDRRITLDFEEELSQVRKKYDKIRKTTNQIYDNECKEFIDKCDETEGALFNKLCSLDANFKNLTIAKDLLVNQNEDELKQMREYCEQVIKRYENFTATTSFIFASKDDWIDAQHIPDIRAACRFLMVEMKKEYPELESLSDFVISDVRKVVIDNVTIAKHTESVVKLKDRCIIDIISRGVSKIVITQQAGYSHITVFNSKGEIQLQIDKVRTSQHWRYCRLLSEFKFITVWWPDEISINDVRDVANIRKNIGDVNTRLPFGRYVSCVTTDPVKNHIIVGTDSREVYVYTDQLNFSHKITLPNVIDTSYEITVHRGSLLVCDNSRGRSFAVTMEESQSNLMYEFTKPDLDGLDWRPISVCTDKNEFIYMLWNIATSYQWGCILVQYSQDGRQLLTSRIVYANVNRVSTLEENGMEKLLISTTRLGELYTFDLVVT